MERISSEALVELIDNYKGPTVSYDETVIVRLAWDLKDARAEIDRLKNKVELLQGPGEA